MELIKRVSTYRANVTFLKTVSILVLNMLVKPMRAGVTATVIMDCCHSGSVLDLPYKFGSEDRQMSREEKFDMSVVKVGVRKEMLSEKEWVEKQNQRKKESKEMQKKAQKRAEREEEKRMCGPKLTPSGQPVLPSRPAPPKPPPPSKKERPASRATTHRESKPNSNQQASSPTKSSGRSTKVESESPTKQSHKFKMPNQNSRPPKQEQAPERATAASNRPPSDAAESVTTSEENDSPTKQAHKFKMPSFFRNKKPLK